MARARVAEDVSMDLAWIALQFTACAVVIAGAGTTLSLSADRLADAHGWGRGWVGLALLATVTSLPELASGISAVALVDAPNLAIGNVLGACVVNLAFLSVVDALQRRQPMYREASPTHLLSAGFGVVMVGFVALSVVTGAHAPVLLHVGIYSPALLAMYLLALRSLFGHDRALRAAAAALALPGGRRQPRREWLRFALSAVLVVCAGSLLPELGARLARASGLSRSFTGAVFMAVVTTLPEMVVTLSALRLRALDMAIGNLLGSNLFNVAILAVADLFYTRGPLLAAAAPEQAASAAAALLMYGLVIVGLAMRPHGRVLRVTSWVGLALVAAYAIHATMLYLLGDGG